MTPSHQLLGTTLCLNHQLTQRLDESMTEMHDNFPITVNISFGSFHKKVIWADGFEISISILFGLFLALFISIWGCIGFGDGASWGENMCTIGRVTPGLLSIFGGQCMNCTHK